MKICRYTVYIYVLFLGSTIPFNCHNSFCTSHVDPCGRYHFSRHHSYDCLLVFYLCKQQSSNEKSSNAKVMRSSNMTACNVLRKLMKGIKQFLSVAVIKASLLLRCGDVERNPGPPGKQKHHGWLLTT